LFLLFAVSGAALAAGIFQLRDIYEAQVPVAKESQAVLGQAFQQAMTHVLIRVTGDAEVASAPGAGELVANAEQYVQSYRFVELESPAQRPEEDESASSAEPVTPEAPRTAV